ncbi:MAG: LysR family transcriptional regulator [Actinomycetia bacterium]|nr:LysR family transcriptional regulator [Actinomycetes bacterium]
MHGPAPCGEGAAIDLDDLALFRAVVHCGSVSRAARQYGYSQPAVSRRLRRLEREVGHTLLDRSTVPLLPTAVGRRFLALAETVLDAWRTFQTEALGAPVLAGRLEVAASSAPVAGFASRVLAGFVRRYPGVKVALSTLSSRRVEETLVARRAAVGFMGCPPADCCLAAEAVASDEIVLAVPLTPEFETLPDPLPLDRLASLPLVRREAASGTWETAERALAARGVRLQPVAEVDSAEALYAAIQAGLGVGFVSREAAMRRAAGAFRLLRLGGPALVRPLYLVYDPLVLAENAVAATFQRYVREWAAVPETV